MKYPDGQEMRLGDLVDQDGHAGCIVFSIDSNEYTPDYPCADWDYLGSGVMILFDDLGLVHYSQSDEGTRLVARATTPSY